MAINFTDSPADGATQVISGRTYTYNSAKNKWDTTATEVVGPTAKTYATVNDLPGTALTGDQAFVSGTNRLYIWNGSGWYNIALINTTPTISGVSSSYTLATDGTATTVTITATDPEGLPITYSIASDTSGNIATVTSNNNVFTITPSTNTANAGTFSLTFRASDGVNIATAPASFTLQFKAVNSNYTTALITSVGTNNQVNNDFVDSSTNSHTVTVYGNTTQTTFSPYRHGGYSTYFDGSGDYLDCGELGDLDSTFTIEMWLHVPSSIGQSDSFFMINTTSGTGKLLLYRRYTNNTIILWTGSDEIISSSAIPTEEWVHLALTRNSSNLITLYLNGVNVGTATNSTTFSTGGNGLRLGAENGLGYEYQGYLRDVRVVKGSEIYTSNFTPPTEPLTAISGTEFLGCHLPYFADGSTNNNTITVNGNTKTEPFAPYDYETYSAADNLGSIYFDQSGDYLRADTALDASTSAGDPMTVETWFNVPSSASLGSAGSFTAIWGFNAASGGSNVATFGLTDTGFYWHRNTSGITLSNSWGRDQWHHLAVVYHDGTNGTAVYLNGKSIYTNATAHTTAFADCVCGIGAEFDAGGGGTPGNYFPGHLADFRITHSAVYTSNFTPPAVPLTEITNTALLLKGTNAGIIDKSQSVKILTLSGDTKSTTAQTKYLSSSMNFNTGSDYISIPSDAFAFGTSDFTIEFWIYHTSTSGYQTPLSSGYTSAGSFLLQTNQNAITYRTYHGSTLQLSETASPSINTWYHIAIVRDGGTMTIYRDGTATATGNYNNNYTWSGTAHIGAEPGAAGGPYAISGYMSDLRITRGLARYTSSFTPPTEPLKG